MVSDWPVNDDAIDAGREKEIHRGPHQTTRHDRIRIRMKREIQIKIKVDVDIS